MYWYTVFYHDPVTQCEIRLRPFRPGLNVYRRPYGNIVYFLDPKTYELKRVLPRMGDRKAINALKKRFREWCTQ